MIKVKFKIDGLMQKINRMITLSGNLQPILMKIRGKARTTDPMTIIGGISSNFVSRGSFFQKPWPDLTNDYAKYKAKKWPGQTMLRRTNKLFRSVTIPGADGNVEILEPTRISWGVDDSSIPYAKYLMTGTSRMKRRMFLGFNPEQKRQWKKLIAGYLKETEQV